MKTKFFKTALPAFAFMLAIVASFAFSPVEDANLAEQGYIYISEQEPCQASVLCANTGTLNCTVDGTPFTQQVFGKVNPSDLICPIELKRD